MPRGKSQQPLQGKPTVSPEVAIEFLSRQMAKADSLLANRPVDENAYSSWHNTTKNLVAKAFGENHPNIYNFDLTWGSTNYTWSLAQWEQHRAEALESGIAALRGYIEELGFDVQSPQSRNAPQSAASPEFSNEIFIVHGHDGELKEATARLIEKLGLVPIILHEQANKGRTIIEKFSDHAKAVGFAVVLLSADDEGRSRKSSDPPKLRARQNVVFELGFFFGSLGRGRVCAVYENGVDLPSDLHGVLYVECDQGGSWKYAVAKEIKAAGYEVDLNQV